MKRRRKRKKKENLNRKSKKKERVIIFDSIKNLNETLGRKKYKEEKQSWKK